MMLYIWLGIFIILFVALRHSYRQVEAFEASWEGRYKSWREEYFKRFDAVCPVLKKINTKLQESGDSPLDVRAGGTLVSCGARPPAPESPTLDQALIFFADFPDEAEQILLRSAKTVNTAVNESYDKIKKALSTVPEVPQTKVEAFFAGVGVGVCGADSIKTQEQLKEVKSCKNVAEIPPAEKEQLLQNILQKHLIEMDKTPEFYSLVKGAQEKVAEMEKIAKQAQDGTLPVPQIG